MIRMLEQYEQRVCATAKPEPLHLALSRPDGTVFTESYSILPPDESPEETEVYLERQLKMLLWQKGGSKLHIAGNREWADRLRRIYSARGAREFDANFIGQKLFAQPFEVEWVEESALPAAHFQ